MNNSKIILAFGLMGAFMGACETPTESVDKVAVGEESSVAIDSQVKLKGVAMVNSDTILRHYEYAVYLRDELTALTIKYDAILRQQESKLRSDADKLQREASTLSQFEGQNRQRKLYEDKDKLQMKQEEYARELMGVEQKYNRDIHNAIKEYLEIYCDDKPYSMVLSNSDLGIIRWADESVDITNDVLSGLNQAYQDKSKVDSTQTK